MKLYIIMIISVVLAMVFGVIRSTSDEENKDAKRQKIFNVSTVVLAVVCIIICFSSIIMIAIENRTGEYREIKSEEIIALQDNTGISGRGSRVYFKIDSQQYVIMAVGNSSHYTLKSVSADLCTFYACSGNEEPHIVTRQYVVYPDTFFEEYQNFYRYKVYVPNDCLVQGFNIDLE